MKGLLLAGGHGTRLRPLTFAGNKHMIPIANRPMLYYALDKFARAGIRDVGIVLGPLHEGIREAVGDGASLGLRVTYIEQGAPKGLAHAILCARTFLGDEPFVMHLGDNLLEEGLEPMLDTWARGGSDAVIAVTRVPDPRPFGVVELDGDRLVSLEEKPAAPRSDLALVGVYLFGPSIHPIVAALQPSRRGELEVTEAIARLHADGKRVAVRRVEGWWKDTGRPEDLLEANRLALRSRAAAEGRTGATVAPTARLDGPVALGPGAVVGENVLVTGPTLVGARARLLDGARVGPNASIGDDAEVRGAVVRDSMIFEGARVDGPIELAESILGRGARCSAGARGPGPVRLVLGDASVVQL